MLYITRQMLHQLPIALEVVTLDCLYICADIVCKIEIPGLPYTDFFKTYYYSYSIAFVGLMTSGVLFLLQIELFDINELNLVIVIGNMAQ